MGKRRKKQRVRGSTIHGFTFPDKDPGEWTDAEYDMFEYVLEMLENRGDLKSTDELLDAYDRAVAESYQDDLLVTTDIEPVFDLYGHDYESSVSKQGVKTELYKWMKTCSHSCDRFELEDGLVVLCSSYRSKTLYSTDSKYSTIYDAIPERPTPRVDVGVYFDFSWARTSPVLTSPGVKLPFDTESTSQSVIIDWPDREVPRLSVDVVRHLVEWMLGVLESGKTLEIGCIGGHGRTGTMAAVLLVEQGLDPVTAVLRVWKTYCPDAIESSDQLEYIMEYYEKKTGVARSDWLVGEIRKKFETDIEPVFVRPETSKGVMPQATAAPIVPAYKPGH